MVVFFTLNVCSPAPNVIMYSLSSSGLCTISPGMTKASFLNLPSVLSNGVPHSIFLFSIVLLFLTLWMLLFWLDLISTKKIALPDLELDA